MWPKMGHRTCMCPKCPKWGTGGALKWPCYFKHMQVTLGGVNSKFYMKIVGYHKSVVIENRYHKYHNVVLSVVLCVVISNRGSGLEWNLTVGYQLYVGWWNWPETVENLEVMHLWELRVPENLGALKGVPNLGASDWKVRRSRIQPTLGSCWPLMSSDDLWQPLTPKLKINPPYLPLEVSKNISHV